MRTYMEKPSGDLFWVLENEKEKTWFNTLTKQFQRRITDECIFNAPGDAYNVLKGLGFNYLLCPKYRVGRVTNQS